jgi:hypothetical protein
MIVRTQMLCSCGAWHDLTVSGEGQVLLDTEYPPGFKPSSHGPRPAPVSSSPRGGTETGAEEGSARGETESEPCAICGSTSCIDRGYGRRLGERHSPLVPQPEGGRIVACKRCGSINLIHGTCYWACCDCHAYELE